MPFYFCSLLLKKQNFPIIEENGDSKRIIKNIVLASTAFVIPQMQLAVPASNEFVFPHKFKINGDTPIPILNYIKKRGVIIERKRY